MSSERTQGCTEQHGDNQLKTLTSPSEDQLQNLSRMLAILSRNQKAKSLARSLWQFLNYRLDCAILENGGEGNSYHIDGIYGPDKIGRIQITISIRRSDRQEEGLVHELLHLDQIRLGYPTFWIDEEQGSETWRLAGGIINNADHIVIKPIYLSFGYAAERFLSPSRPLTDQEQHIIESLQTKAADLATPNGYLTVVSTFLRNENISFKPMHLADAILTEAKPR